MQVAHTAFSQSHSDGKSTNGDRGGKMTAENKIESDTVTKIAGHSVSNSYNSSF